MTEGKYYGWKNRTTWNAYNLMTFDYEINRHYETLADTYANIEDLADVIRDTLFTHQKVIEHVEPDDMEGIEWMELAKALRE